MYQLDLIIKMKVILICSLLYTYAMISISAQYIQCPAGLRPVDNGKPGIINGCGPQGDSYLTELLDELINYIGKDIEPCCNVHDLCYDKCAEQNMHAKNDCDYSFSTCMYNICIQQFSGNFFKKKACVIMANTYYNAVSKLGNEAYLASQNNHCECVE